MRKGEFFIASIKTGVISVTLTPLTGHIFFQFFLNINVHHSTGQPATMKARIQLTLTHLLLTSKGPFAENSHKASAPFFCLSAFIED